MLLSITDSLAFLRQLRLAGVPFFDVAAAFLGMFLLAPLLTKVFQYVGITIPRSAWLWWTLPIGVLFHTFFSQNTPVQRMLANPAQVLPTALFLLAMVGVGLWQVMMKR